MPGLNSLPEVGNIVFETRIHHFIGVFYVVVWVLLIFFILNFEKQKET